jgi:hypothetical protein
MNFASIRFRAALRGIRVGEPASITMLAELERFVGAPLSEDIRSMYLSFNGFKDDDFDVDTYISIWPIEKILKQDEGRHRPEMIFGDIAMDAILLLTDPTIDNCLILTSESDDVLAPNIKAFWNLFMSGGLDF